MKGFTLIEIAIVLSITVILSSMLIGYNRASQHQIILFTEQARVVGFLTRAKAFALEKNIFRSGENACGFGVHFKKGVNEPDKLILFRDLPIDVALGCVANNFNRSYTTDQEKVEELIIDQQVKIEREHLPLAPADIFFEPPYLAIWLGNNKVEQEFKLKIKLTDNSTVAFVKIGPGGDISAVSIQ